MRKRKSQTVRLFLGDKHHAFRLGVEEVLELERQLGAGIGIIAQRVFASQFGLRDITETVRLALIGGGTPPQEAADLVAFYLPKLPLTERFALALAVLEALFSGRADSQPVQRVANSKATA